MYVSLVAGEVGIRQLQIKLNIAWTDVQYLCCFNGCVCNCYCSLGLAYAGSNRDDIIAQLTPVFSDARASTEVGCFLLLYSIRTFIIWQWHHLLLRHVLGQRVISDVSIVHSCWSICSLCSESNNIDLLLCLLVAVLGTSILLRLTYNMVACTWWAYIVNLVTSLHLIYIVSK